MNLTDKTHWFSFKLFVSLVNKLIYFNYYSFYIFCKAFICGK